MVLLHAETFQNPCTLILLLVVVVVRAAPAVQPTVTVQLTVQPTDSGEPQPAGLRRACMALAHGGDIGLSYRGHDDACSSKHSLPASSARTYVVLRIGIGLVPMWHLSAILQPSMDMEGLLRRLA